jgi:calcineurin-like phosphoesterase family protein
MTKFITSDIHFNHRQIVKYNKNRVSPYFTGDIETAPQEEIDVIVAEMNAIIILNWNSVVRSTDDVYILGDVAMGQIKLAPDLIKQLNGNKFLIAGNHDKTLVKLIEKDESLKDMFVWIKDYKEMSHTVDDKKHMICMSHFPMRHWHGQNRGTIMLHGHLHGSYCDVPGRIFDVGMDTNNLFPYLLDTVVKKMLNISLFEEHHSEKL